MIEMKPLSKEMKLNFKKQHYKIVGQHSACKLCYWTKESIKTGGKKHCYKEKFYSDIGIKSHRCLQCTPSLTFCTLRCKHCWRDISLTRGTKISIDEDDNIKFIIDGLFKAQKELLTGLGGVKHSEKYLKEAYTPKNIAISLSGEPFCFENLSELIKEFHKRDCITFLVTNGTFPEKIEKLETLPTQLYVSLTSSNKEMMQKLQSPLIPDAWERLNKTLDILPEIKTRKVIRMTMIKNINTKNLEKFVPLILKAKPNFIEVKSYIAIGSSRERLGLDFMLSHKEIKEISEKISKLTGYEIKDEQKESRVVLLKRQ
ncbi:MAG: 4-demethylwyosine synthase TYW1 [Candidatus Aenigmarchaeota archaeon]|nr:4-demethylwyosine synthase TYW1 [Candidatus Aenigmarchaeota archaeon]